MECGIAPLFFSIAHSLTFFLGRNSNDITEIYGTHMKVLIRADDLSYFIVFFFLYNNASTLPLLRCSHHRVPVYLILIINCGLLTATSARVRTR